MRTSNSWPPERLQKSELSMIRRVKEDALLVDLDVYSHSSQYASVNSWMDPHRSMLEHHENDAKRVRESLVTLLSLKQREVNAESLINSELQSQILFVFTAATVLFTPLSWVSSLLALKIKGFTPEDEEWSIKAAGVASSVTVAGFILLMVLCLLVWRWRSVQTFAKKIMQDKLDERLRVEVKRWLQLTNKPSLETKSDGKMSPV